MSIYLKVPILKCVYEICNRQKSLEDYLMATFTRIILFDDNSTFKKVKKYTKIESNAIFKVSLITILIGRCCLHKLYELTGLP